MRSPIMARSAVGFPAAGAWRLHPRPGQLSSRATSPPKDRFDDPQLRYRVRYLATTRRGCMLEVLDHFRPNLEAETKLSVVAIDGYSILDDEPAGSVPDRWLSVQQFGRGSMLPAARFADVRDSNLLAELNEHPDVKAALAASKLGRTTRLDGGTIRLGGPIGRAITQAVSRAIHDDENRYTGICYRTRFDDTEDCWAVFDDRAFVTFDPDEPLSLLNTAHMQALHDVAARYNLTLPPIWN